MKTTWFNKEAINHIYTNFRLNQKRFMIANSNENMFLKLRTFESLSFIRYKKVSKQQITVKRLNMHLFLIIMVLKT